MMKRILALLLTLVLLLTACATKETAHSDKTRRFTDDFGREVMVPTEILRIVPSSAMAQIILYAIAPDMLVGLATDWGEKAEGIISDTCLQLPNFSKGERNIEELALTGTQLIIDIGEPKDSIREELETLQTQTQIPAVFVSASLQDMPQTFRVLGELLGRQERAEALAQFCERVYTRTLSILERVEKVDTLYVLGEEGLNVLAKGSYHAELVDMLTNNLAVVDNPISKGSGNAVTMEQIALWNPELIIFGPESIYADVAEHETWKNLRAVADGRYMQVPDAPLNWMNMPPSVQRYLGMLWLTSVLYPEACDYDLKAEIKEYFKLFYSCELSDAQYEVILSGAFLQ